MIYKLQIYGFDLSIVKQIMRNNVNICTKFVELKNL